MIEITVDEKEPSSTDPEKIKRFSRGIIEKEKVEGKNFELHLVFLSRDQMVIANNKHRGVNSETDVISIPLYSMKNEMAAERSSLILLGDVLLCEEYICKYCKEYNLQFGEQVKKVIVHGILHLFGYKHDTDEQEKTMNELQNKYIEGSSEILK